MQSIKNAKATNEENLEHRKKYYQNMDIDVWLRTCDHEITEPINGTIKGTIPLWLKGSLMRNGPGSLKVGTHKFEHLFDASALLHRFCIEDGDVTYQSKFLQSEVFKRNQAANRILFTGFGTKRVPDPCSTIFQKLSIAFESRIGNVMDNNLVSVYPFGDEVYALGEYPIIHRINKENLDAEARINAGQSIAIVHHTAHPHITNDGSIYNLAITRSILGLRHSIVKFCPQGDMFKEAAIVAEMPSRKSFEVSYMHSFGITDNYFVIVEHPLSMPIKNLLKIKLLDSPLIGALKWSKNRKTKISLLNRKTGKLSHVFYSEPFCFMHIINQYEISDYVVIDLCKYHDASVIQSMYISTMENMHQNEEYGDVMWAEPARLVLPLKPSKTASNLIELPGTSAEAYYLSNGRIMLKPEKLLHLGCELPRINYEYYNGKPYRYFYSISNHVSSTNPGAILKIDLLTKTSKSWSENNCYLSEAVFVPRPNSQFEDDGVVLCSMLWGGGDVNHTGLLILDAATFEEVGRAEFRTPGVVPRCLHGWYFPK